MRRGLLALLVLLVPAAAGRAEPSADPARDLVLVERARLEAHEGRVRTLAFHRDGALLATGGPDRTVRLTDIEAREEIARTTFPRYG